MTRPLRIEVPNGIHHVMSRGIEKRDVFEDDVDRRAFLLALADSVRRFRWRCISYCQMGNHYHLLVQTPYANLAEGMRDLNGEYATGFNARRARVGALFKHRYKSQLVQDNAYLLTVARYIALNPVRGGLVARAEEWPWGSFADLHAGRPSALADVRPLLAVLGENEDLARQDFLALVAGGSGLPPFTTRQVVGDPEFVARHAPKTIPKSPVARVAWEEARPALSSLVGRLPEQDFLRRARFELRYTLREIAEALGCSAETVRRRLNALDG